MQRALWARQLAPSLHRELNETIALLKPFRSLAVAVPSSRQLLPRSPATVCCTPFQFVLPAKPPCLMRPSCLKAHGQLQFVLPPLRVAPSQSPACQPVLSHSRDVSCPPPFVLEVRLQPEPDAGLLCNCTCCTRGSSDPLHPLLVRSSLWTSNSTKHVVHVLPRQPYESEVL